MDAISKRIGGALRDDTGEELGDIRKDNLIIGGRLLKPDDRIYDLVELVSGNTENSSRKDREIIVIDGRVYERVSDQDGRVHDLVNVAEKGSGGPLYDPALNEEISKRVAEITERIAREMVPDIAERVIREEIEKLKKE